MIRSLANTESVAHRYPQVWVGVCTCGVLTWLYMGGKNKVSVRHRPGTELLCRVSLLSLVAEQPLPGDYGHLSTCRLLKTFFFAVCCRMVASGKRRQADSLVSSLVPGRD